MKTKTILSTLLILLIAVCASAPAMADGPFGPTRDDCGPIDVYTSPMYCGSYTQSNGGHLLCQCFGGEVCVNSQDQVIQETDPGTALCTTGSNFTCSGGLYVCEGHSLCPGPDAHCCIPQPCPANTCGDVSDGCGGTMACSNGPRCHELLINVTPEFPGQPIHRADNTPVSLVYAPFSTAFTIVLTAPDGTVTDIGPPSNLYTVTDMYGDYSGIISDFTFNISGTWHAYAVFPYPSIYGFRQSEVQSFWVAD